VRKLLVDRATSSSVDREISRGPPYSAPVTDELLARVEALEARLEILDLEGRYAYRWDTADPVGWADLFTEDGSFAMAPSGGEPGARFEGKEELERFCRDYTATVTGLHLMHLPALNVDGDRAVGHLHVEFRSVRRDTPNATQQASVSGYYDTTYRKTTDGWRIAERVEKPVTRQRTVYFDI
jgi:hypothetical protein